MAIAGLHNVSVIDSPFLRNSQSRALRRRADEGRASTRASSILQMWRELEDEHVVSLVEGRARERSRQQRIDGLNAEFSGTSVSQMQGSEHNLGASRNECGMWPASQIGLQNENVDLSNSNCEQSLDFGEVERERVRQTFREWMNSGGREHTSNGSQVSSPRSQWLGENECERVRIIREWVQMNCQQRGSCFNTEEQAVEIGAQIERVRDGLVVNQFEGRTDNNQRRIRKLCGRQALLDMLAKSQRERQRELQGLLENRAVSHFAHRNRIQSLLRGRFLRNGRLMEDVRPTSNASSELGLLRQRNTVSGLREGFMSRLDNFVCGQVSNNHSDTLSISDIESYTSEQTQANSSQEVPDEIHEPSEPSNEEINIRELSEHVVNLEGNTVVDMNAQESTAHVEGWRERRVSSREDEDANWRESTVNEWSQGTSRNVWEEQSHLQEARQIFHEHSEPSIEENDFRGLSDRTDDFVGNMVEDVNWQESASQLEDWHEQVTDIEETNWQQLANVEFSDTIDGNDEEMDGNWQASTVNDWSEEMLGNEGAESVHLPETNELWHDDEGSQDSVENWFEGPSEQEDVPVARINTYYVPDDDNVSNLELRELLNRRSVSNLLRSGFRESLDRLIQSYVERQGHSAMDWDSHDTSLSPTPAHHDPEQQSGDQNEDQLGAAVERSSSLVLPPMPPQPLWDRGLHEDNWAQQNMHQRMGSDWEIINDLRLDMTRLQQRMNNMQRMLEACMDMQLELQRSIRQEVSAALNRSDGSSEVCEDGSKWDLVRKGICCICSANNIDSLLYRCGHMCTCANCANKMVENREKCPMCQAPVVEVIRAYSIQ